jgi:hypothetical protein
VVSERRFLLDAAHKTDPADQLGTSATRAVFRIFLPAG